MSLHTTPKIKKPEQNAIFSAVLIKLLQGVIASDEKKYWEPLINYQESIREYFSTLGLQLHLSMDDGYAFLKQNRSVQNAERFSAEEAEEEATEDDENMLEADENLFTPTLIRRIPLPFEVSFLCVLLREALEQFDSKVNDDHRLVLHRVDIYELLKFFHEEKTDETKQVKRFDALINRVVELGFLKELKGNKNLFEVRRIIKAQFDAEKLLEIKNSMLAEIGIECDE